MRDLDYYLAAASRDNPLLKDLQGRIEMNRLDSMIAMAAFKPQLSFNSAAYYAPTYKNWGYDPALTDNHTLNALLSLSQTILLGRDNMRSRKDSYGLETGSIGNEKKISERDLKLSVTLQYITAFGLWEELSSGRAMLDQMNRNEQILRQLTSKAVYRQIDYLNFQVGLQQQQLLVAQQRAEYKNNIALLNYLCGIEDTTAVRLAEPDIALRIPPAFESTAQYRQFQLDSLKIRNSASLLAGDYRPRLTFGADAGYNSSFAYQPYKNFGISAGVALVVPIYDGGQRAKQMSKIATQEAIRRSNQEFSGRQYRQQIAQLSQQLTETDNIIARAQTVVQYSQAVIDAYAKLIQTGEVSITDYMAAVNNYMAARQAVTQSMNARRQIINQINYWKDEN